jgi:EpsI family protein
VISLLSSWSRFGLAAILLAGTLAVLHTRKQTEVIPVHTSLRAFPNAFHQWQGQNLPLTPEVLRLLGPGEFLFRDYVHPTQPDSVNLFVAFFPSQSTGDTIHSPKNCLPAEGWSPIESGRVWLENPGKPRVAVNRYLVEAGDDRAVVLYWYQAHGRITLSEYWAKFYLIADSIRTARSDGALVRIFAPIEKGEDSEVTQRRAVQFSQQILPILDDYIPR